MASFRSFNSAEQNSSRWTKQELLNEHVLWLANLDRGPVLVEDFDLVHGAPDDEDRYMFHEHEAEIGFRHAAQSLTFFGHTHVQGGFVAERYRNGFDIARLNVIPRHMAILPERSYLINPGAVGQPRDGDTRAAYCIYDSNLKVIEFYRTEYDIRTAQEKIWTAGLPEELAYRLATGD